MVFGQYSTSNWLAKKQINVDAGEQLQANWSSFTELINPSNAETTFNQSTRMQSCLKTF